MPDNSEARFDPIPESRGKRSRPTHTPTERNRNKIRLLLARGWTSTRIAQALRNTSATLGKHYFRVRWRADAKFGGGASNPHGRFGGDRCARRVFAPAKFDRGGYLTIP